MAFVFCDGFDQYSTTTDVPDKWDVAASGFAWGATLGKDDAVPGISVTGQLADSSAPVVKYAHIADLGDTVYASMWVKFVDNVTGSWEFFGLGTGGDTFPWSQVAIGWSSTYLHIAERGNPIATATTTVLSTGTWYHLELEVLIDSSAGTAILKLDGVEEINATGLNTAPVTIGNYDAIRLGTFSASYTIQFDDIVVWNDTGTGMTTWVGEHLIDTLKPNGEGTTNDWTPSTGIDNSALVDDSGAHNATDYVHSTTATNLDLYTYEDMAFDPASIHAVQLNTVLATGNTPTTPRSFHGVCRSGGANYDETTDTVMEDATHRTTVARWDLNPNGDVAWDTAAIDAAEFGIELDV